MSKLTPTRKTTVVAEGQQYRLAFYEPAVAPSPAAAVTIKELPVSEQPSYRLEHYGAGALSITELLAITAGLPSLSEAETLLVQGNKLAGLAQMPWSELVSLKGLGRNRAARIKASFELGRRLLVAAPMERPSIKSPADAANLLMLEMATLEQEHLVTIILDTKNHVLKIHTVYIGSLNTAVVRVGELFKEAVRLNAAAIIVCHNHPSGDPTPSPEDVHVTRQIVEAGKLLSIDVLDHLVIGQQRWVSLKERGLGF
jgi:DNA repair protein RadC